MNDLNAIHTPVLLDTCIRLIAPALRHPDSVVVDCTLGLAGHACALLAAVPQTRLIGIDRDGEALALATKRIHEAGFGARFTPVHAAFDQVEEVLSGQGLQHVDAAFMDLGLSSLQIDERDRGFSYSHDAPLDMRMDTEQRLTAREVLATYDVDQLTAIFRTYGEERFARPIARQIVRSREERPLLTSGQLDRLVDEVVPRAHRAPGNPAKRVFQALRIEVNGELDKLARTLPQIALHLAMHGRLVVESYHSLEDRTVKRFMNQGLHADVPAGLPVIPDEDKPFFSALTRGAIKAEQAETEDNPRSKSVRLRGIELTRAIPPRFVDRFSRMARLEQPHTVIRRG